ncbi:unnamed protein product [Symbiodinium sp. CCMP2456]|nr:unnamed protein product [Symbiodinium sp. CCMP2456]
MFLANNNDLSDSSSQGEAEPVKKPVEKQRKKSTPKEKAQPKKTNPPKEKKNPPKENPSEQEKKNPPKENPSEQNEKNPPKEKNPSEQSEKNPPKEKKNPSKGMKRPAAENEHQDQHEGENRGYKLRPYRKTQAMAISRTSGGQVLQVKAKGASFEQNTEVAEVLIKFLRDGTPLEEVMSMKANMCSELESKIAGK